MSSYAIQSVCGLELLVYAALSCVLVSADLSY